MKYRTSGICLAAAITAVSLMPSTAYGSEPQQSARLEKAKDYIADEQWLRAIDVLKAASTDAREKNKDEALFWLAHSQHQARDLAAAVETIAHLERSFPTSRWVKPARSLRVELAQKLRRDDVLWWTATAPTPPSPPVFPTPAVPPAPAGAAPRLPAATRPVPRTPRPPAIQGATPTPLPPTTPPPTVWVSEHFVTDNDLRIQALGSLMQTDAVRVIPMLRTIALESHNPSEASRAVFVLAQSGRPDAHSTVLEVAKRASEPVSVNAVRMLGRFGGPHVSEELMQVYTIANPRVKYQVVNSLGERLATTALLQIAQSEPDSHLRDTAIVTLGQAGGRVHLQRLDGRARIEWKRPIILGLFNARAEDELIQIAERESDPAIKREILSRLRLLGTPKAKQYVERAQSR